MDPSTPPLTQKRNLTWVYVLVGVVLLVAVGVGVFWWQQMKVDQLQADLSETKNELTQAQAKASNNAPTTPAEPATTYSVNLSEISMKLSKVPNDLAGLIYAYTKKGSGATAYDTVSFSSKKMTVYCPLNAVDSPLGVLFKRSGTYPTGDGPRPELIKQFDGFYISYREPQQPCAPNYEKEVDAIQKVEVPLLKTALKAIEQN